MSCNTKILIGILLIFFLSVLTFNPVFGARLSGDEEITETSGQPESTEARGLSSPSSGQTTPPSPASVRENRNAAASGETRERNSANTEEKEYFEMNFDDVDIRHLIQFISEKKRKTFLIDNNVKGKITIISDSKISMDEAYKVFESVLEVNGFAAVPSGAVIKIVPAADARTKDIDTISEQEGIDPSDKLVTQLIPLKYADPEELKKIFTPFVSKNSIIVSYGPTGMLIVTDVLSNIHRLLEIIEAIDVPGTGEIISVLPLKNATASLVANSLNTVFKSGARAVPKPQGGASQIVIVADERTNTLVVLASEIDTLKIKELLNLLDREIPRGEGDIHVYYLQNANAEDLSKVLMSIPSKQGQPEQAGTAPVLSKDIQIVADKATNSLIITAKKEEYTILEDVIHKLDIPRRMVYIEALIMEVSMTKQFELGVQWLGGKPGGYLNDRPIGVFSSSNPGTDIFPTVDTTGVVSMPSGFSLGVIGEAIEIGGIKFPSIGAVIRAFASDSDVQILSTPQIMTTDNEEAEIKVVDNIPFITRRDTTSNSDIAYSNYEFKDVGVILNITPQINQERFVRLKIEQEVSQVVSTDEKSGQPTTLKRNAKTTVVIKDEQTIVIGGLIDEADTKSNYKVPVLGSIPVLGNLFKSRSNKVAKKNLYIFLTPHIVENPDEAETVFEDKKGHIDNVKEGAIRLYEGRRNSKDQRLADAGYYYMQIREYEKALKYFTRALKVNPENPYALLHSGHIHQMQGEKIKAGEFYNRLIEMDTQERAYTTIDPLLAGKRLTDIAEDYLKEMNENETDR